jgi:hypothetical protein
VHNWVELVYKAFGQTLPTRAKDLALLGVRETLLDGSRIDPSNRNANEGNADTVDYKAISRVESMSKTSTWDDLLFAVSTESEQEDSQGVDVYQCAIDPKTGLSGTGGTPYVLEGKLYRGYPGKHSEVGGKVALHLFTSSVGNIVIAREATNQIRTFKTLENANTVRSSNAQTFRRGEFVREENNDTIHIHFARADHNTSVGCTVLAHKIDTARYVHFMKTFNDAPNSKTIPYLVVSSQYVRLYDDWVKQVDGSSDTPGPETVIMRDQLRSPKGMAGKYLPSIMTTEFANAVIDSDNAVMRASLEKALFTV